jgi:hypothetical protein
MGEKGVRFGTHDYLLVVYTECGSGSILTSAGMQNLSFSFQYL